MNQRTSASVTSRLQQEMETDDSGYESACSSDDVTKPRVIFVFDEARGLLSAPDIATSPFYNIRRALRVFFRHPCFFALMLDTDATMSNFLRLDDHSARARPYGVSLLPPIYYLPTMNLHGPQPGLKFEDYVRPSTWIKYGRPLWAARMQMDPDEEEQKCRSIVELAGLKLLRTLKGSFQGKEVNVLAGDMTESQAMAMLTAAAGLEVWPRSMLAQTMTASHMSLLLRVMENRSVMFVALPPEPVLSEAAAGFLSFSEKVQVAALRHMVHACRQGYTTPGPRGEFVAKYILVA